MKMKNILSIFAGALCLSAALLSGCKDSSGDGDKVIVLSPHSDNIKYEIDRGFKAYYAANYGKDVTIDWRDIGGGGSAILSYIRNVYSRSQSCGVDILYGAGETPHQYLAADKLLERYDPKPDYLAAVPQVFSGSRMYDKDHLWHGTVLSSFGFIYNKELLSQLSLAVPNSWDELGDIQYCGHIMLADPTQSSSIAAAYEMVLQSEQQWQKGWEKLLNILSNAKKFTASSAAATNAPVIGEAVIAACIDYYGALAVGQDPDKLGYISPAGGTGFTPDPISILKNAPNIEAARRFIDYTLSFEGQSIWALMPGTVGGPDKSCLNRSPIRSDVYEQYGTLMPQWIVKPYALQPIEIDPVLREKRYDVLKELIKAAAVDNSAAMMKARRAVHQAQKPEIGELFYKLPEEVDTVEEISIIHDRLGDEIYLRQLRQNWSKFFRDKYAAINAL